MHACTHAYVHAYIHKHARTCIYAQTRTYMHIYTNNWTLTTKVHSQTAHEHPASCQRKRGSRGGGRAQGGGARKKRKIAFYLENIEIRNIAIYLEIYNIAFYLEKNAFHCTKMECKTQTLAQVFEYICICCMHIQYIYEGRADLAKRTHSIVREHILFRLSTGNRIKDAQT